jgi:hypothetical protein
MPSFSVGGRVDPGWKSDDAAFSETEKGTILLGNRKGVLAFSLLRIFLF